MTIVPIDFKEANAFVQVHHRHHKPVRGHKFSITVADDNGKVVGVAMVGRPVARRLDDGWTLEVNRLCTDGTKNACSMLYAAAWSTAKSMGFARLITYTLPEEGGGIVEGKQLEIDRGERGRQLEREDPPKDRHRPLTSRSKITMGSSVIAAAIRGREEGGQ